MGIRRVHLVTRESDTSGVERLPAVSGSMVNTYTKGNRVEKKCRELFEAQGWLTWKPSRAKYNSNDAFGLFDCILIRGEEVAFMQVKSQPTDFYQARKEIEKWIKENKVKVFTLVSLYKGGNEWRIEGYYHIAEAWLEYPLTTP